MPTAVVTGANKGIGLELCRQLAARGDRVIAACRSKSPELAKLGVRVVEDIEVTDRQAVGRLAEAIGSQFVDLLVNNAGVLSRDSLEALDLDGIRRQFEVNAIAPLLVTSTLLPKLREGSKVAIVTSRMGSIADNGSGGYYGYRMSKAAVNMAGVSLARDLAARGIAVLLLHPGMVATSMTGGQGIAPAESAANLLARMDESTLEDSGSFRHANGERLPW